jgi:hypothetical protein
MTYAAAGAVAIPHGIYVSRASSGSEFEAQIGTIWQKTVIDEIIDAQVVAPHSAQIEATPEEVRSAIESEWPVQEVCFDDPRQGRVHRRLHL